MSLKNSNDTIGNRTRDLPVCSLVPYPLRHFTLLAHYRTLSKSRRLECPLHPFVCLSFLLHLFISPVLPPINVTVIICITRCLVFLVSHYVPLVGEKGCKMFQQIRRRTSNGPSSDTLAVNLCTRSSQSLARGDA